jgi:hypothetical protein
LITEVLLDNEEIYNALRTSLLAQGAISASTPLSQATSSDKDKSRFFKVKVTNFVKVGEKCGEDFVLDVRPTYSIRLLKEMIEARLGMAVDKQRLWLDESVEPLKDAAKVEDCGLKNGEKLFLFKKPS